MKTRISAYENGRLGKSGERVVIEAVGPSCRGYCFTFNVRVCVFVCPTGRKPKPAKRIVPLSRTALVTSSSQRRFSSETGVRMFSLTNSPTSAAARRAKLHSTARLSKLSPSKQKRREKTSPALDDILNEASVEVGQGDGGKVPSLSELLADGSLWDS